MNNNTEQNVPTQNIHNDPSRVRSSSKTDNCLPVGTQLAEFDITGIVGEGGFGTVYLAKDRALQRTVAIKEYMPGALAERGADKSVMVRSTRHQETFDIGLKSFINEARLLAQFDHPALIKVHRFWEENKTGYMAMRYYEGQTLKAVVKNTPHVINETWLKNMLKPVLDALDALYNAQILHRDVSPDNIMIQSSGEAVLLDFGAARQIIGDATQALTVILKPGYAPIEQYADDSSMKQGAWTDIYALSAVIYYCIIKKPPPTSVARMIKDPISPLQKLSPDGYSQQFLAAIDRGLCVNPELRPRSISEFRKLLGIGVNAETPRSGTAPAPAPNSLPGNAAPLPKINIGAKQSTSSRQPIKSATAGATTAPQSAVPVRAALTKKGPLYFVALAIGAIVLIIGAAFLVMNKNKKPVAPLPVAIVEAPPKVMEPQPTPVVLPEPIVTVAATPTLDDETVAWNALKTNADVKQADLANFVQKYPLGKYTGEAKAKLATMTVPHPITPTTGTTVTTELPPKITGSVRLSISPWGKVTVDGFHRGTSPPLKKLALTEGKHEIKISNPNFPDYITEIDVSKNSLTDITHEFSLDTRPTY